MKLGWLGSLAIMVSSSCVSCPAYSQDMQSTDLRQQETAQKYVVHIGEPLPVMPEQIRPSSGSPIMREWTMPPLVDYNQPTRKAANNLIPQPHFKASRELVHRRHAKSDMAPVSSRGLKPVPIASAYETFSQDENIAASATRSSSHSRVVRR